MNLLHKSVGKEKIDNKKRNSTFKRLSKFENTLKSTAVQLLRTIRLIS